MRRSGGNVLDDLFAGLRVVDLTQNVAGPFCTQILGDLGAEVIKIERPKGGDDTRAWSEPAIGGESPTFLALNRNKRSVCVDLGTEDGVAIVKKLAATADIVVHSMKPGSAEGRGLGAADLQAANPRLVYCAISAFGEAGPLAALPGYDPLMQAFSGIMSVTGSEGDDPVRVSVSLIDMGTGMWAAMGIMAALMQRERTGRGLQVNASLLETAMSWMTIFVASYFATGKLPRKLGSGVSMTAPYELFRTRDGYAFIAAANDRLFAKVCDALGAAGVRADPRFATNLDRTTHRQALHRALEESTLRLSTAEVIAKLRAVGAPCSEMNDVGQAVAHPQVQGLGMVAPLPRADMPQLKAVPLPLRADGERIGRLTPPPHLGRDTSAILTALGYGAAERERLVRAGVTNQEDVA